MSEELQHVDESVLNSLLDLRRERDALSQRLARMQEAAAEVSEKVLARVRSDYEARIAALEDRAAPLKDTARGTYGKLLPLLEGAREACEAARLDLEEIELRHKLGEFDDSEHRQRADRAVENQRAADERVAALAEVVARFESAFDSSAELAPATTSQVDLPARPAGPASAAGPATPPAPPEDDGTLMLPPEPPPAPEPPPPPAPSPEPPRWEPSAAWSRSNPATAATEEPWKAAASPLDDLYPPPAATAAAVDAPAEHEAEAPTSGLPPQPALPAAPRARLEALDGDLEPQPHFLEPLTFVGRTPENQIRIYKPAVSRRHAQITETEAGWLLRDLSSENGTYVNGQRVTERLLADGDRVQFGTSRFILRLNT